MAPEVAHPHLAAVELDEELDEQDRADGSAGRAPAWLRQHAVWVAAASVAVLLALLAAQSMLDARERARLEYLADVPGVLSPLHDPPGALHPWAPSAGALVAEDSAGRWTIGARYHLGGVDLRGTDPDTGDVLWSVPFSLDAARRRAAVRSSRRCGCAAPRRPPPAAHLAVCAAEVSPARADGGVTPLLVLDPADRPDAGGPVAGARLAVVGGGLAPRRREAAARRRRRGALGPHRDRPCDGGRAVASDGPRSSPRCTRCVWVTGWSAPRRT